MNVCITFAINCLLKKPKFVIIFKFEVTMKENKMGIMPINKLLITMSLPMMASMLILALYNIVDSIFIAQISEDALTAVSLAFPIQNLMIAIATGTGVGINALVSRYLGQKDKTKADKVATTGVLLMVLSYFVFLIFGVFGSRYFFEIQGVGSEIVDLGTTYISICSIFCFGIFLEITFERLLQSTGKTLFSMFTQGAGAIINIILDPILIFGFGPIPAFGIAGAAIATVSGQCIAALLAFYFNHKYNHEVDVDFVNSKPNFKLAKKIYGIGLPSIIMVSIGSLMTFGMNQILMGFSKSAAAFFGGIYIKLQSFVFMPVFGLNNGLIPIVAYNFGAKNKDRIIQTIRLGVIYAVLIMTVGFLIFQIFPTQLLSLFSPSESMLELGTIGLRVISIHFVFAAVGIVLSTSFQALGHGTLSLISSVVRQLVVLLPAAYLLSLSGNISLVWLSFPIAELASVTLCVVFFVKIYRNQILVL